MKIKQLQIIMSFVVVMGLLVACSNNKEENLKVEDEIVVTIGEKTFSRSDLEFYTLMKNIQIEINRHFDLENYDGDELGKRTVYWNDQLNYNENINVQLQNMIEIYAMSLFAEEKQYDIPYDKLEKNVDEFKQGIANIDRAKSLIDSYGENDFNHRILEYARQSMLRDRVVAYLEEELREDNPGITEMELNYDLSKNYEELYMEQVGDLLIQVHVK